jgi:hypothetical protein
MKKTLLSVLYLITAFTFSSYKALEIIDSKQYFLQYQYKPVEGRASQG